MLLWSKLTLTEKLSRISLFHESRRISATDYDDCRDSATDYENLRGFYGVVTRNELSIVPRPVRYLFKVQFVNEVCEDVTQITIKQPILK